MTDLRPIDSQKHIDKIRRDFVANASHELRTPLTVLRGYIDIMYEEATANSELAPWREALKSMSQQSQRMEGIIGDMLTLARLEVSGSKQQDEYIDVAALLDKIMDQAKSMASNNHNLVVNAQPDLALQGQTAELENALSNLVFNALQHTPPGTRIDVFWQKRQGHAVFEVKDNSPGISAKHIPRLTERFYRVNAARSRASGGTGLGLAIVKHALERHDSYLEVFSPTGSGATFRCQFPPERIVKTNNPHQ